MRRVRLLHAFVAISLGLIVFAGWGCGSGDHGPGIDEILQEARMDLLADQVYAFPANRAEQDPTVYLPLRKWDIIFVGGMGPAVATGANPEALSVFIPGQFDHIIVYVGKDRAGNAYAVELNTDDVSLENFQIVVLGGLRFICLGKDYGQNPHPSGAQVLDRSAYRIRWARTFSAEDRTRLAAADDALIETVRRDIFENYPYEFELRNAGANLLVNPTLTLVDDGRANGAGCGDYWTGLFEEIAGICIKDVRWSADRIEDYYRNDPVGSTASLPGDLNPLGAGDLPIASLLGLGVHLAPDPPHNFSCDGTKEQGLVLPVGMYTSGSLVDILPIPGPGADD